jgi:hypothetical protein
MFSMIKKKGIMVQIKFNKYNKNLIDYQPLLKLMARIAFYFDLNCLSLLSSLLINHIL